MAWQSVEMAGTTPMDVFHCEACDKLTAASVKGATAAIVLVCQDALSIADPLRVAKLPLPQSAIGVECDHV
jgi:hypothetical protein